MRLPGGTDRGWRKWALRGAIAVVAVAAYIAFTNLVDLEKVLQQLNHRRASGQVIKSLERYMPADARIGSIGFFTVR